MSGQGEETGKETDRMLDALQRETFQYFVEEVNPDNGLVRDRTAEESPASITAIGLGLAAYAVGAERGLVSRNEAAERALTTLRFLWESPQSGAPDATGYKGFYYHFLDMEAGRRAIASELSTIDTTFLLAGALAAAAYFTGESEEEEEIRELADALYRRVDWRWALNGGKTVSHGWRPEHGFLAFRWEAYSEALLLYALGLGSPTHPLPEESYAAWTEGFEWREIYDHAYVHAGPLFIHQLSHVWVDLREIQDDFMRGKGIDYFENSRRAALVQQEYAVRNPLAFKAYGERTWGITASAGPGDYTCEVDGRERQFYGYLARGVPEGPDDGTLSPWAVVASLPFAPEIVLPTIRHYDEAYPEMRHAYGYRCSFNPTFPSAGSGQGGWVSSGYYGLNQGPIVLMIENYRTGLLWQLMKRCPYLVRGLRRGGFSGGWLSEIGEKEGPHSGEGGDDEG
jgi:hypothetical protein